MLRNDQGKTLTFSNPDFVFQQCTPLQSMLLQKHEGVQLLTQCTHLRPSRNEIKPSCFHLSNRKDAATISLPACRQQRMTHSVLSDVLSPVPDYYLRIFNVQYCMKGKVLA
jgi:hypothetical protein